MVVVGTDPCYYCGRALSEVRTTGCGSKEFPQARVNELCEVYQRESRKKE